MKNYLLKLREKLTEALNSVLPIIGIVMILCFTIAPISSSILLCFLMGAAMIVVGTMFFTLGAEISMTPMGERLGTAITRSKKLSIIVVLGFVLGFIITISEPDLQVLAEQVPSIPNRTLILSVALGVGVFLVIALLRMLFSIALPHMLIVFYILAFVLTLFVPQSFLAVAFDSGGVTTGPMTVPFIMAFGIGISAIRNDRHASDDSFGLVALCSIGPTYIREIAVSLFPIILFFGIFQIAVLKLSKRNLRKIIVGLVYTYIGLVLFLTGANVGFMPAGNYLGQVIASLDYNWIIVLIGMLIGFFIVKAEPAVYVLNKQVEEITDGAIPARAMSISLSIGVAVSIGIAMLRVLTGISILWFIIPGYAIALGLSFFVPKIFTAIAFDSGGVASGPMITIQILGMIYQMQQRSAPKDQTFSEPALDFDQLDDDAIIEL